MIKEDIFERLCKQCFLPDIDLFASRLNRQLETFVTWFPEPGATFVNAFSRSWEEFCPYVFPPFNLVGKVINKIVHDKVDRALIVFPYWPSMSWFPLVLESLCALPIRLPRHRNILTMAHDGREHPMAKRITMVGAVVSGNPLKVKEFHQKLQSLLPVRGPRVHVSSINLHGKNGVFGMKSGLKIHFQLLKRKL